MLSCAAVRVEDRGKGDANDIGITGGEGGAESVGALRVRTTGDAAVPAASQQPSPAQHSRHVRSRRTANIIVAPSARVPEPPAEPIHKATGPDANERPRECLPQNR
jgi:hypothetical protein